MAERVAIVLAVRAANAKKEYYLTDVVSVILGRGHKVVAVTALRPEEAMSVNDAEQLEQMNRIMAQRPARVRMDSGSKLSESDSDSC